MLRVLVLAVTATLALGGTSAFAQREGGSAKSSQSWDQVVAAANKEGSVTIYGGVPATVFGSLKNAFQASYPNIQITAVPQTDATLEPRIDQELKGQGTADAIQLSDRVWMDTNSKAKNLIKPVGPDITAAAQKVGKKKLMPTGDYFNSMVGPNGWAWNTKAVPNGVHSWQDLLKPELANGKIGIVDAATSPTYVDLYSWIEKNVGKGYLKKLAAQKPRIYPFGSAVHAAVISGEVDAGIGATPAILDQVKNNAATVDFEQPPDAAWGPGFVNAILKSSPHPNAAQVLANWFFTPAGIRWINDNRYLPIVDVLGGSGGSNFTISSTPSREEAEAYVVKWNQMFRG